MRQVLLKLGPRGAARRWLPRRTVRLRLTLLYGSLFLLAGALLLTVTYVLVASNVEGPVGVRADGRNGKLSIVAGAVTSSVPRLGLPGSSSVAAPKPPDTGVLLARTDAAGGAPFPSSADVTYARQAQGLLRAALDRQRAHELDQLLMWSGAALGVMALASIVLGWLMAGRVLAPLRWMTVSARQISAENLNQRLALDGPDDELKELGDTVDGLLGRLERSFEAQRRFVANASHELRTPLTLQRATIEVALADDRADAGSLRDVCRRVLVAGEQQENLIEALLTLARSDRGLDRRDRVDLEHEVKATLNALAPAADGAGLRVELDLEPAALAGEPRLVGRLAANLIDNAVRHNVPDGWVRVATGSSADGRAWLRVSNSGPVIVQDDVAELLEPFRRASTSRTHQAGSGHGLGLSIAVAIADAHDGELLVRARPSGGLEVEARFPGVEGRALRSAA